MNDRLLSRVKKFLSAHFQSKRPVLLGFSGGPDSTALLHLLVESQRFFPNLEVHLAHIDHSWRRGSSREALSLKEKANNLGLPFHLHTLSSEQNPARNLEAKGREERLNFFLRLHQDLNYEALLLAHHREDQEETVLKRVLEGAHLLSLGGMESVSTVNDLSIWRPLLTTSKQEILKWLADRKLDFINDSTNQDTRFLRSRMRLEIFPQLSKSFGKEILGNLSHLAESIKELKTYFAEKNEIFFKAVAEESLDFNPFFPLHKVPLKVFLKAWGSKMGEIVSRQNLDLLSEHILSRSVNKRISVKNYSIHINKGVLFWSKKKTRPK